VFLVRQDGSKADAAVIVDGDVEVFIACTSGLSRAVAVDAVPRLDDAGQTFDIEVDQVSRTAVLKRITGGGGSSDRSRFMPLRRRMRLTVARLRPRAWAMRQPL
jgi:hypothetical protein